MTFKWTLVDHKQGIMCTPLRATKTHEAIQYTENRDANPVKIITMTDSQDVKQLENSILPLCLFSII